MPTNAKIRSRAGVIEVAPNVRLRSAIIDGLHRIGPMTAAELGDLSFWGRHPRTTRLGDQWRANENAKSATRRAIAALRASGKIEIAGRRGRSMVYRIKRVVPI